MHGWYPSCKEDAAPVPVDPSDPWTKFLKDLLLLLLQHVISLSSNLLAGTVIHLCRELWHKGLFARSIHSTYGSDWRWIEVLQSATTLRVSRSMHMQNIVNLGDLWVATLFASSYLLD